MIRVQCCIVGGGPAGMMLGFLLARAGVEVAVLEKHGDFLRDFRGDTLHPSTMRLFDELGLAGQLLRVPHQETQVLGVTTDGGDGINSDHADWADLPDDIRRELATKIDRNTQRLIKMMNDLQLLFRRQLQISCKASKSLVDGLRHMDMLKLLTR